MFDSVVISSAVSPTTPLPTGAASFLRAPQPDLGIDDIEIIVPAGWRGESGADLGGATFRVRAVGLSSAPAIVVLGGISANRFVSSEEEAGANGWWGDVARRGGGVDLNQFRIIGVDYAPREQAEPLDLTPADYARLVRLGLDGLGVDRIRALVGASFGGMVGLAFARLYPEALDRLAVIAAAHRPAPMARAWRLVQRRIIRFALDAGQPAEGVALARQLAMTTYRTDEEWRWRFAPDAGGLDELERYLDTRGADYAAKVSAARYLTLSGAIDAHDERPENIATPTLLIATDTDRLAPLADIEECRDRIGASVRLEIIRSIYGHDAFLKEAAQVNAALAPFLEETFQ